MIFEHIGFIGLGLIGGSIAKAIKQKYPTTHIIGHASHSSTLEEACNAGVIENSAKLDIAEFASCDLLFLCSPVGVNVSYLEQLAPILSPSCMITDVGSVKGDIHHAIDELGLSKQFIGGHPMTGSEKTGFSHSAPGLLENAYYILTSTDESLQQDMDTFAGYIASLGAIPIKLTPSEHDFATAAISHLPHVISATLVNLVKANDTDKELLRTIAAGGFKDITRISSSSPVMWQHICQANRDEILKLTDLYIESFTEFQEAIRNSDATKLHSLFTNAKNYRDSMQTQSTGILPSNYEFYCDLMDEAGGIATIATILAAHGLNIKNIGIVHDREFEEGVLHIEMYDHDSMEAAITYLQQHRYNIHRKK
ncbi:MAG: prephenate dehydrogenase/arogenate dehydrogenase family protein [Lachnospiraceae bacterium]|nr:prephenate dehydrogenase/arogenate dehydrogenase family protein [Lachnospiraceae bacterium]